MWKFQLEKPPGKATVFRILRSKRTLQAMWPDSRQLKRERGVTSYIVQLDITVAEAVAFVESGKVALSGGTIIALDRICAAELRIPADKQSQFTRDGWLKHFLTIKFR